MDHLGLVASLQVPEDGGVVEEGQVDHVLALLELGRVDATDLSSLEGELLVTNGNDHLGGKICTFGTKRGNVARLKKTLLVDVGLGVHDPDGLLGVVHLGLILPLHLDGWEEVLRWVGVNRTLDELDMAGHDGLLVQEAEK